ncbi:MAG: hypothetical protein HC812_05845 [Leptolyngbya sp. RL_3_1]|nr:hypothetical protein [Leptolyngbya sp. RL_3_1]
MSTACGAAFFLQFSLGFQVKPSLAADALGSCPVGFTRVTKARIESVGAQAGYSQQESEAAFQLASLLSLRAGISTRSRIARSLGDAIAAVVPAIFGLEEHVYGPSSTIRDATDNRRSTVTPDASGGIVVFANGHTRFPRDSAFYEAKTRGAGGNITGTRENSQGFGYVAHLANDSPVVNDSRIRPFGTPLLVYLTNSDTRVAADLVNNATINRVPIWQTFMCENQYIQDACGYKFRMSNPFPLNPQVYLAKGLSLVILSDDNALGHFPTGTVRMFEGCSNPPGGGS